MVTITNSVERNAAHVRCIASLMGVFIVIYLWLASVSKLSSKGSEGEGCGGWHDSVSEEAEFVGSIVTGDAQLGIVHPTGRPIKVSTQRGLSLPLCFTCFTCSSSTFPPVPGARLPGHPALGVAQLTCPDNIPGWLPSPRTCPFQSPAIGVAHDSGRFPSVLGFAWTARPSVIPYSTLLKSPVSFQSLLLAVGQDEDSLALVRCAAFRRAEYAPRCSITQSSQVAQNVMQPTGNVALDVFKEAHSWSKNGNAS